MFDDDDIKLEVIKEHLAFLRLLLAIFYSAFFAGAYLSYQIENSVVDAVVKVSLIAVVYFGIVYVSEVKSLKKLKGSKPLKK